MYYANIVYVKSTIIKLILTIYITELKWNYLAWKIDL